MINDPATQFAPLITEGVIFHPVIPLPPEYEVYDFTQGYDPNRFLRSEYGVGRYDEKRPGMYAGDQFTEGRRDIHVGIDIAAPVGEPVRAFYPGKIFLLGDNDRPYDYGPTIITQHRWLDQTVYTLHGHLSRASLAEWNQGDHFDAGTTIGWVGASTENGGWNPHLHFQLSLVTPTTYDLPGVVSQADREWALTAFPDPQLVLGSLY